MPDLDPKIALLRRKLALVMGPEHCPAYDTIKVQHPHALDEPWSADMSGPHKHVVFDNKAFTMLQVPTHERAYVSTDQPYPIDCGENIKLYLDDNLFRDLQQGLTMDWSILRRTEAIVKRAVRSKFYYWLKGWVDMVNGGPGDIGPPPSASGKMRRMKAKGDANRKMKKQAEPAH